ncbi:MAG TPA: hypothetical protein VI814_07340 [Candidatus Limnocylindria bacterium]
MSDTYGVPDLEQNERDLHQLLAVVPPQPLPIGFRDAVMARLRSDRRVMWEWIVAAVIAVPSLVFLARQIAMHGEDFTQAIGNILTAASADTTDAFFFVDGLTIVALALVGVACAVAAHALSVTSHRTVTR